MKQQKRKVLLKWLLGAVSFAVLGSVTFLATGGDTGTIISPSASAAMPALILSHAGHSHDERPFRGRGDKCVVQPTSKMRRDHMEYILDQRDKTVHKGIRTKQFRLQRCVNCHADPKSNSVLGDKGFCQHCHKYTAVRIDCFSCHTDKAEKKSLTDKKSSKGAK